MRVPQRRVEHSFHAHTNWVESIAADILICSAKLDRQNQTTQ
jgi:hypothetical protein